MVMKQVRMIEHKLRLQDVAWIDSKFAKVGLLVGLKARPGVWEIMDVYEGTRTEEEAHERERDYTRQRAASDV
jgi:hypothetical protein